MTATETAPTTTAIEMSTPDGEAARRVARRLRPLYMAQAFGGLALWVPVEKLFMAELGFDAAAVGLMAGVYALVVPLLELPSGILADRWSRKGVLVAAYAAIFASVLVCGLATDVTTYVFGAGLLGVDGPTSPRAPRLAPPELADSGYDGMNSNFKLTTDYGMSETNGMAYGSSEEGRDDRRGRALHLLDIENLVGDPVADDETVRAAVSAYKQLAEVGSDDLAVVGSNGRLAVAAGLAWPGALLRVGRGRNGADIALLAEAPFDSVAQRFSRVVIGSGDGIFVDLARHLRLHGRLVTVVARPGSIAGRLRATAEVKLMPTVTDPVGPVGEAA